MKCVRNNIGGKVVKVSNEDAYEMVNNGKAVYVPKHVYKEQQKNDKN